MKSRVLLLSLTVRITLILLVIGAILVVVGIFNSVLGWDIFGPKLEAFLYGIFGSSLALAGFGVAMTFVLGIQEIVQAFRQLQTAPGSSSESEAPRSTYLHYMLYLLLALAILVASLALINYRIQGQRSRVFKRLASEQMEHFQPKLTGIIEPLSSPPRKKVPREIYDLINTLDQLSFVQKTTLYLPDPHDSSAMWGYTAWRDYKAADGFARFFVAKDFEKAIQAALNNNPVKLNKLNQTTGFTWYYIIESTTKLPIAVIRIDANKQESFRDYKLGK